MIKFYYVGVVLTDNGGGINPNLLGIGLVYSLQLTALLQWTVRMTIDAENNSTSVERLLAFVNITPETSVILPTSNKDGSEYADPIEKDMEIEMIHKPSGYKAVQANEDEPETSQSATLKNWPSKGAVRFENLKLRYRPELDLVVHGKQRSMF